MFRKILQKCYQRTVFEPKCYPRLFLESVISLLSFLQSNVSTFVLHDSRLDTPDYVAYFFPFLSISQISIVLLLNVLKTHVKFKIHHIQFLELFHLF